MFIVGCLQFVDSKHLHAALSSAVARTVCEWRRNTAKEWFCEAIRKLPKRWQRCIT
jgi:hypothetical protein